MPADAGSGKTLIVERVRPFKSEAHEISRCRPANCGKRPKRGDARAGDLGKETTAKEAALTTTETRIRPKEFHFPLVVDWAGGRKVTVQVDEKAPLDVAPPPVFRGTERDVWSPEDLFVAASASCLAVTFTGLAERKGLAFESLEIRADGTAGMRADGNFGFIRVELDLRVAVAGADAALARELCEQAEENCLVSASFDLPVDVVATIEEIH